MRYLQIAFALVVLFPFNIFGQGVRIDDLMKIKPHPIGIQKVDTTLAVYLPMPFASANFISTQQLHKIPSASYVYSVNLIYTEFREVDSFNQPRLNYARFNELKKIYPEVFERNDVEWNVLEQRAPRSKEKAQKCFHGFIIFLKNSAPPEMVEKEISKINTVLNSYKDTLIWIPETIEWKIKRRKIETGYYLPKNNKKKKSGEKYSRKSIWFREPEYEIHYDSSVRKKTGGYWKKIGSFDTTVFRSTDEFNILARRKWSPKIAVVTDVTGSMSPFSTQVMLWLKYSPQILQQGRFTFFNDGDAKPDIFKRIGNTGGIYFAQNQNFDSVFNVMKYAMYKGLGGDLPENNLEAVIKTLQKWPDTDTVLLISDINASVKDIQLLGQIDRPVSVMLCGLAPQVPQDYINIVKSTGGKLFMLNTEIESLKGLYTGQKFLFGGKLFEWRNNTFQWVK